jgi:ATP-binding cassette subfamily F protein 3
VLLQLNGVSKSYGAHSILRDVTFQINPGEKIGLIGPNGSGKTTLLGILSARSEPDEGTVSRKTGLRTGTLDQIPNFQSDTTVLEEGLAPFSRLLAVESELRQLEHDIAETHNEALLDRYSTLQYEFDLHGGYRFRATTEAALLGVGFAKAALEQASRTLSGGEKNRLALAKLLLSDASLLLLDEPTNHLDVRSIEWLEAFLKDTDKSLIVVSHDRIFLDRVVGRILEIADGRVHDYKGNYSAYLKEKAERLERQQKEWNQQQAWIANQEDYIRRNIAGQKTKQAQSRRKLLSRVQRIERPRTESRAVKFRFLPVERGTRQILKAVDLSVGYNEPLIRGLNVEVERRSRWAILGANGAGKTTLLKTLTGALAPLEGELQWSEGLELGYYDQQLAGLGSGGTVLEEIRELDSSASDGELRSYLAQFLFSGDDVFKPVANLSGGEKSRVALAKIIYEAPAILALDEPTNHLDIASREALEGALADYPGTILFVTHDRYLAQKIATHLLYVEAGKAHIFDRLTAFEEWLNDKGGTSKEILAKDGAAKPAARPVEMSKNEREKRQRKAAQLEARISELESNLAALEQSFANPDPAMDWEQSHRRHSEIREELDRCYGDLDGLWS